MTDSTRRLEWTVTDVEDGTGEMTYDHAPTDAEVWDWIHDSGQWTRCPDDHNSACKFSVRIDSPDGTSEHRARRYRPTVD